jgi:hypothetical protein
VLKNIVIILLAVATIALGAMYYFKPTSTVYGCSEKGLPPEIEIECRKRYFKRPVMENGCVIQEVHGRDIKTCG